MIMVKSKANNVGLWERHPAHPNGEIFVGTNPVEVAETPAVKQALADGRIELVKKAKPVKKTTTRRKKQ